MLVRSARAVSVFLAASAVLLVASSAAAQGSSSASPASKTKAATVRAVDGHDVYDFPDDPLMGEGIGANIAPISVLRHAARASLVRPRLSFVPEMLKTAEAL